MLSHLENLVDARVCGAIQGKLFDVKDCPRPLAVIGVGLLCKQMAIFSTSEVAGISGFVARVALPAMVCLSIATLDVSAIEWRLVASILLGKVVLFALVVLTTFLTSANEWRGESTPVTPLVTATPASRQQGSGPCGRRVRCCGRHSSRPCVGRRRRRQFVQVRTVCAHTCSARARWGAMMCTAV